MTGATKFRIALVLLLAVIVIFVSPAVNLEPTALRALQVASMLFAALALAGTVLAYGANLLARYVDTAFSFHPVLSRTDDIIDLNCTRLC